MTREEAERATMVTLIMHGHRPSLRSDNHYACMTCGAMFSMHRRVAGLMRTGHQPYKTRTCEPRP